MFQRRISKAEIAYNVQLYLVKILIFYISTINKITIKIENAYKNIRIKWSFKR